FGVGGAAERSARARPSERDRGSADHQAAQRSARNPTRKSARPHHHTRAQAEAAAHHVPTRAETAAPSRPAAPHAVVPRARPPNAEREARAGVRNRISRQTSRPGAAAEATRKLAS